MPKIVRRFHVQQLPGVTGKKVAVLVNPPVYDTQYWARWSQPYGLLRIAGLLRRHGYRQLALFDFMQTNAKGKVAQCRINPGEAYDDHEEATRPLQHHVLAKGGQSLLLNKYHFGRAWQEFETWLDGQGFDATNPPDEIWISATMTYWWESVRDLTARLKRRFGNKSLVILGGIYPTLVPEHAVRYTAADLVVVGEVEEANDLWPDLSLYETPPAYSIVTPSRGCPNNCAYCAQQTINGQRRAVQYRTQRTLSPRCDTPTKHTESVNLRYMQIPLVGA